MTFTIVVMGLLIVYAIKTICKELRLGEMIRIKEEKRRRIED